MERYHNSDHEVDFSHEVGDNNELLDLYDEHKQKDEAGRKAKIREKALKKLTEEERDALELL